MSPLEVCLNCDGLDYKEQQSTIYNCLQILMSVCSIPAIPMQLATTLLVALHVPVTLDMWEMEHLVVSFSSCIHMRNIV